MSKPGNYYKLGLFVIAAIGLLLATVFFLGSKSLFKKQWTLETYFDTSVQGLEVGSPVKFLGVRVGEVKNIRFVYEYYPTEFNYILVRLAVDPALMGSEQRDAKREELQAAFAREVEKGLRIRLAMQGITGIAFLEASYMKPEKAPPLEIDWMPTEAYVPSAPNTMERLGGSVERIMLSLSDVDFKALNWRLRSTLASLDHLLTNEAVSVMFSVEETARSAKKDVSAVSRAFQSLATNDAPMVARRIAEISDQLVPMIQRVEQMADRLDRWTFEKETTMNEMLERLRQIADNIQSITDEGRQYPSAVFFGEAPRETEVFVKP